MNRVSFRARLQQLPKEIAAAETAVCNAADKVQQAKDILTDLEGSLLLGKINGLAIDGKNAEQRQAQLREYTKAPREQLQARERELALVRVQLTAVQNEFKSMLALARLLDPEEEVAFS